MAQPDGPADLWRRRIEATQPLKMCLRRGSNSNVVPLLCPYCLPQGITRMLPLPRGSNSPIVPLLLSPGPHSCCRARRTHAFTASLSARDPNASQHARTHCQPCAAAPVLLSPRLLLLYSFPPPLLAGTSSSSHLSSFPPLLLSSPRRYFQRGNRIPFTLRNAACYPASFDATHGRWVRATKHSATATSRCACALPASLVSSSHCISRALPLPLVRFFTERRACAACVVQVWELARASGFALNLTLVNTPFMVQHYPWLT